MNRARWSFSSRAGLAACLVAALSVVADKSLAATAYGFVPYRAHGDRVYGNPPPAPAAACNFTYYGGPLVSNVRVVPVIWSSSVNAQVTANIGQFYADAVVSHWYDGLSEYASVGGTLQSIGRGSALPAITLVPAVCATSANCTMTDAQLQAELLRQINVTQALPAPELDASGYTNSVYMVHFPPNVTLRGPSNNVSCVQFCAYHGTATFGATTPLPYGAVMDTFSSACANGCGSDPNGFNNETSIAAHELAEAVTDTDVGLAASVGLPLAWFSPNGSCGEIGDPCLSNGTINVGGRQWTVQKLWSNGLAQCTALATPPNYLVGAPASTPAATSFPFTVTARNPYTNSTDSAYVGTVHFTSSGNGILPADYTFVPGDQGNVGFSATFMTVAPQTITATDTMNGAIVGTSASIDVTPAADGTSLSTACPTTFVENQAISLTAAVNGGLNPTGSVTFADAPTVFCGAVQLVAGAASCQTAALMAQGNGTSRVYNAVASYSGDASNSPSDSPALPLTVLAASDVVFRSAFESAIAGCPAP